MIPNQAHLHLLLNHFPIIGFFFAALLLGYGVWRDNDGYQRSGLVLLVVAGILGGLAFATGEGAEEVLEQYPSFSKELVHEHEEAGELAIWAIGLTAVTAAAGLYFRGQQRITQAALALAVLSLVLIGRTNNLGGQISHPEIRSGE